MVNYFGGILTFYFCVLSTKMFSGHQVTRDLILSLSISSEFAQEINLFINIFTFKVKNSYLYSIQLARYFETLCDDET